MRFQKLFDRGPARQLLLEGETRRESGEDKREIEELLKRDWKSSTEGENDERGDH